MTDPLAAHNAVTCVLARRLAAGEEYDDEEADNIRDESDHWWSAMTDAERATARLDSWRIDDALFGNTVE